MRAKLYIFPISHFCEKARWALDYSGIDYELIILSPGAHRIKVKKMGAKYSSVPLLEVGDELIQSSSEIIDWAIVQAGEASKSLAVPVALNAQAIEMEKRLDDKVGVHLRRMFYSEALVEHPHTVKPLLTDGLAWSQRLGFSMIWSTVRKLMIKGMDLGADQALESKAILEQEFEWLEALLSDGRDYLIGDKFSRVDLTAAALLARCAMPLEHPGNAPFQQPPRMQAQVKDWRNGRVLGWVNEMYTQHRKS